VKLRDPRFVSERYESSADQRREHLDIEFTSVWTLAASLIAPLTRYSTRINKVYKRRVRIFALAVQALSIRESTSTLPSRRVPYGRILATTKYRLCSDFCLCVDDFNPWNTKMRDKVRAKYSAALAIDIFVSARSPLIFDKGSFSNNGGLSKARSRDSPAHLSWLCNFVSRR